MAHPIPLTAPPRDPRVELISRLESAPAEHAEAILAAYEVLQGLHDRGVLELLRGALGSGDRILELAVHAARSPESIRSIRNALLLGKLLGEIEPQRLGALTQAVPEALNPSDPESRPPGLWKLLSATLWNGDVRRGLWAAVSLLEKFGRNIRRANGASA
jgi:uncharacterized protein YjgD (DUF1641 family)